MNVSTPVQLASVFALLLVGLQEANASVLRIGSQGDFRTISAGLQAAEPGDTLLVTPGRYRETLIIEKAVQLRGEGRPEIFGNRQGDVVRITSDHVSLSGFRISGSGNTMMSSDAGIKIEGDRARITDNSVEDNLFGIYLKGCNEALIEKNTVLGRSDIDIGRRGAGVHFFDARHNMVRRNKIRFVRDGVYFDHSDFNTVEENEFSDLRYGVHYMYCKDNRFIRNVFQNSVAGVAVMYTERVIFRENQILNNRQGYNAFGLLLKDCLDSVAEGNVIVNNVNGIFLESSHRNLFRNNLVAYNDVGVVLYASSLENQFTRNDFIGNLTVLRTVGRADAVWTVDGTGNYYSNYTGYDLDLDGKGDVPHKLQDAFEYLEGNRPILRLFLNSAAADALAIAEKSFPVVPTSDERDTAPCIQPVSRAQLDPALLEQQHADSLVLTVSLLILTWTGWVSWRLRK